MISVLYFFLVNFAMQTNKSIKFYINILCLSTSIIFTSCSLVVDPQKIKDVDFCEPNPCLNEGLCTSNSEQYICSCTSEWYGDHCENSNSELVGKWKFIRRDLYEGDCTGNPTASYYTNSETFLLYAFSFPLKAYELIIEYSKDLTFSQAQTLVPSDENSDFIYYLNSGRITDTGTRKCIEWDEGSSGTCTNNCSNYTITGDTLRTYNYCDPPFSPCEVWISVRQ